MYKVKLREEQRPVLLRDGKGGPMRVVTASSFVTFNTLPEYMVNDCSLEIEEVEAQPVAEATPEAAPEAPAPAKPQTRRRRRKATPKA